MLLGPLTLRPQQAVVRGGPVKVAVRPEAWRVQRHGADQGFLAARLDKAAYLGAVHEYTFDTAIGRIFVVSSDLDDVLAVGDEVQLGLGAHGVSVVGNTD
ncbi:TOBE domain protein [compost metagenome]